MKGQKRPFETLNGQKLNEGVRIFKQNIKQKMFSYPNIGGAEQDKIGLEGQIKAIIGN